MLKTLINSALALVSGSARKKDFDADMIRITRDPKTLNERVEATDLMRIIRVDLNNRVEREDFFVHVKFLSKLSQADEITHDGNKLCAKFGPDSLEIETKSKADWPDFDRVLPTKSAPQVIQLNGVLLRNLLNAVLAFTETEGEIALVTLELHRRDLVIKAKKRDVSVCAMQSRISE